MRFLALASGLAAVALLPGTAWALSRPTVATTAIIYLPIVDTPAACFDSAGWPI